MKKQIESEKVWFVVGMIFFIATFPLGEIFSIASLLLGFICTVVAYYIAQKKNYETFYELYLELKVPWKGGDTKDFTQWECCDKKYNTNNKPYFFAFNLFLHNNYRY